MKKLEMLGLSNTEKEKLSNILNGSVITNLKFFDNKTYIFLMNSDVIILNNSTKYVYNIFNELKEEMLQNISKSRYKKNDRKQLSEWTDGQIKYLKENFFIRTLKELEDRLGKSRYQLSLKAIELKIVETRKWSDKEIEFLRNNMDISNYELAKEMKRTVNSIKSKKRSLLKLEKNSLKEYKYLCEDRAINC
ncbi:hypothetical protein [Cetobacterium sp.]|uniref:hypothetical protein n=1 Tax=Cetobacterium sp. TaxID=2071632 RepID=UPI003F2E12BB